MKGELVEPEDLILVQYTNLLKHFGFRDETPMFESARSSKIRLFYKRLWSIEIRGDNVILLKNQTGEFNGKLNDNNLIYSIVRSVLTEKETHMFFIEKLLQPINLNSLEEMDPNQFSSLEKKSLEVYTCLLQIRQNQEEN